MKERIKPYKCVLSYLGIGLAFLLLLSLHEREESYLWNPWCINLITTLLYVLFVWLTARLAKTDHTVPGIWLTGLYILFFCPGADKFLLGDEEGLMELASECIVPFFMGQYTRIRRKDFHYWYFLMLLMGIFCSYTHNGVTIPLCITFLWLSFRHLKGFFRMACWPMVIGFAIGTMLSILYRDPIESTGDAFLPATLSYLSGNTITILRTLWDTKVFVLTVTGTGYLLYGKKGRQMLLRITRRHYALSLCAIVSLITVPLAPLGIDNAVHGVCFFSMYWLLFLTKYMAERYWHKRI